MDLFLALRKKEGEPQRDRVSILCSADCRNPISHCLASTTKMDTYKHLFRILGSWVSQAWETNPHLAQLLRALSS